MIRFVDSMDHYDQDYILAKYTSSPNVLGVTIATGLGRCATNALDIGVQLFKGIAYASDVTVTGFAVLFPTNYQGDLNFFKFVTAGDVTLLYLHRYVDGSITIFNGSNTAIATTAPDVTRLGQYYYLEIAYTRDASAGVVTLFLNNIQVATFTGNTGASTPTGFAFMGSTNGHILVDDFYTLDNTGGVNTTRLGDVRVQYLEPAGPGAATELGLVGAATNWEAVNDGDTPDGDTSYVWSDTVGDHDLYEYEDVALPFGGSIYAVQINPLARKTDAGARSIASVTLVGGVEHASANSSISETYQYWHSIWQVNPETTVAWTKADLNDAPKAQFGPKVTV